MRSDCEIRTIQANNETKKINNAHTEEMERIKNKQNLDLKELDIKRKIC